MIQIKETDALWRFYNRNYRGRNVPEPKNLCNYFWKAVEGAIKAFICDVPALIVLPILWGFTGLVTLISYQTSGRPQEIPAFVLMISIFSTLAGATGLVFSFAITLMRWFEYWENREEVCFLSLGFLGLVGLAFMLGTAFKNDGAWHWYYFFYGLGIELTAIVGSVVVFAIWYFCFSDNTNLGKNTLQYLRAVKSKVCPLVVVPQSYTDEKKRQEINCSDG
jgi:hypothetical protein